MEKIKTYINTILTVHLFLVVSSTKVVNDFEVSEEDFSDPCPFPGTIQHLQYTDGNCTALESEGGVLHLTCHGGLEYHWMFRQNQNVHQLTITDWPLPCFSPDLMTSYFPFLRYLAIENSSIATFSSDFPASAIYLKHLKLSGLGNLSLSGSLLSNCDSLEVLDLRRNHLETLNPDVISTPPNLTTVYLYNNSWNCSHLEVKWMSRLNTTSMLIAKSRIVDFDNLTCQGHMFKGKPLHVVMDLFTSLREECPKSCHCFLTNLVRTPGWTELVPVSTADCRWRGMMDLPSKVPAITTVLLLHGNKIRDLRPLVQNPTFKRVADVYLDDNQISSVRPLEGSDWILSFRILSLRGNNITQLPTHVFDNAFHYNRNIGQVYLGKNPWRCDCHFTPAFQELLLKHQNIIQDLPSIKCAKSDNEDISEAQIQSLSRSAICRQPDEILLPLDILNVILSILIIIVLVKFAYDYYWFKKNGKLPWIVTKIP